MQDFSQTIRFSKSVSKHKIWLSITVAGLSLGLFSNAIFAQQSAEPEVEVAETPEKSRSRNRLMEEVVVTAQKRAEDVQDVPSSVAAFSGDMLAAMGVDDPMDLQAITPGLTYNTTMAFTIIYLRGVGSDAFLMADPSVATYIDGIYYPFGSGLAQSFGKVERIEVLKGPQGTLFGRNTTGGAISITTETPSFDEFYGSADYTIGQYTSNDSVFQKMGATFNVPVTDYAAFTLAVFNEVAGNYYEYDDDSPVQNDTKERRKGGRVKFKMALGENFDFMLAAVKGEQTGTGTTLSPNTETSGLTETFGGESQPRDYTADIDTETYFDVFSDAYYGELNGFFDIFDAKLLLSDQAVDNYGITDFDGTREPIIAFGAPIFSNVKTAELQFLSNESSWGADWMQWIAGLYYIESEAGLDPAFSLLGGEEGAFFGVPVGDVIDALPGFLSDLVNGVPLVGGVNLALEGLLGTKSHAAFLQTTFYLTDRIELTLGGRYQDEVRTVLKSNVALLNADGSTTPLVDWTNDGQGSNEVTSYDFSPKVSFSYAAMDNLLVYLTWQKGFKSGTFNTINITDDIDYAEPEYVEAYELGAKYQSDSGLTLNAAIFYTTIEDLQVQFTSLYNGGAVTFENAGAARIQGIDFDFKALIFPSVVSDLVFTLSGAYLDAIYTDYKNGSGFDEDTGQFEGDQDFTGNRIVRTPEYTATLALSKSFTLDTGFIESTIDAYYNSGYAYQAQNTLFFEDEYHVVNARVSYFHEEWDLRLTLSGKNLTESVYGYSQFPNDFGRLEALAPPMHYSLSASWNF